MIAIYIIAGIAGFVVLGGIASLVGVCIHHAAARDERYLRWLADLAETSDAQRDQGRRASTTRPR